MDSLNSVKQFTISDIPRKSLTEQLNFKTNENIDEIK